MGELYRQIVEEKDRGRLEPLGIIIDAAIDHFEETKRFSYVDKV